VSTPIIAGDSSDAGRARVEMAASMQSIRMAHVTTHNNQENQPTQPVFRTEKRRLAVFAVIAVSIMLVSILNGDKISTFWYSVAIYVLAWVLFLVWLACYGIKIDQETLTYTTFGRAPIAVNRADILRVEVPSGRFRNEIKIERRQGGPMLINAKPFSRSDLPIVAQFRGDKLAQKPNWM
jgi:hypothetical protein